MTFDEMARLGSGATVRNRKSGKLYRIITTEHIGEPWDSSGVVSGQYRANRVVAVQIRDGRQYGAVRYIKPESYELEDA